jgi:tetratricopeptide (TPR) repeat protein
MAKTRLNKNIVVGLTLFAFLIMILASFVMLRQLQARDPAYYTQLAREYDREGDWKTAALFYQEAWERSNDAMHLVAQGESLLSGGAVAEALQCWKTALTNRPDLTEAHTRQIEVLLELAQLYGRMDHWERVRDASEAFLGSEIDRTAPQAAFAHHAYGLALVNLARRDPDNAERGEAALREAIRLDPNEVDYALDLAAYLIGQDRAEQGAQIYQDLMDRYASPGHEAAKTRQRYAEYLARQGRIDNARTSYEASLQMATDEPSTLREVELSYARFLSQRWARAVRDRPDEAATQALFDEAEAILRESIAEQPEDFAPYRHLAVLYELARRYEDVIETCEARLRVGFSREGIEGPRNRIATFQLMIQASEACVALAVEARRDGDQARREAQLDRADQYVADASGEFPTHPLVYAQRARVKVARGLDRQALEDLRAADEAYEAYGTVNWETKTLLARVHLRLNEAGAAKAVLDGALEIARQDRPRDAAFWTLYAQVLFATNEYDRALSVADQVLADDATNEDALRIKAAVFERKNRPDEAGRFVEDQAIRAILSARQLVLEGDTAGAVATLKIALAQEPADPRLVREAVRVFLDLGRTEEARAAVDAALAVNPDDPQLQGLALLTREDLPQDEREEAMLEIIESQEDAYQRALALIGFHSSKGDRRMALQWVDQALAHLEARDTPAALNASTAQHRVLLSTKMNLAAALDDAQALEAAREAAVEHDVDGAGGLSIVGLYHMHRKEYQRAAATFRRAVEAQPTDVRSLIRLGQCLQILGEPGEAQVAYERAVQINPNEGGAHKGMAMLAKAGNNNTALETALAACERLIPHDPWVRAELLARQEQAEPLAAIARREARLAGQPGDTENLRRLAWLCELVDDTAKADEYYNRLVDLLPDDKDVMVTASKYYRRTGRAERSLELVTHYATTRETPEEQANAQILVAAHHLALGDKDAVERALLAAADTATTFEVAQSLAEFYLRGVDRPDQALPWLDQCATIAETEHPSELPRVLAARITCLLHRELDDQERARREVEVLRATFPDYARGLLLSSEVHARSGAIDKAIEDLSDYLAIRPNEPGALLTRALHRRAQGRTAAAVEDLETIKRTHPLALDLEPRFLLARLHKQAGRPDLWLREIESIVADVPDAQPAVEALARAYMEEERWADAERIVTAEINRAPDDVDATWRFLRGRIALAQGDTAKALMDYQGAAEVSGHAPEALADCLGLFGRLDRPADGVAYYEQHATGLPPAALPVSRYALLLAQSSRTPQAVEQFRRAMNMAMAESAAARRSVTTDLQSAWPVEEGIGLFQADSPDGDLGRANRLILSRLHWLAGQYDEAEAALRPLIDTCTDDRQCADLLQDLGDLRQVAGRFVPAREAYEQSLEYNKTNWVALNNLAYVLSDKLGEYGLARPYAQRAVALVDRAATLDTLGWIYVGLGDYEPAIAELNRAIRLEPDDALTYYHLGEAYRRDGRFDKAQTILVAGQDLARASGRDAVQADIEASLERVRQSDRAP